LELAKDNIRVNAISPGAILTDMNRKSIQEAGDAFLSHIPMHRVGEVSDVTGAAIYLAGNESAYVTGTTLYIDGAYRLHTIRI
ncbi:SDR family oxidoreductase, partial [candidate division KSB1 bacterium]|nr:SDR family oxidoreductase [candidate division KSB1 bacterium]